MKILYLYINHYLNIYMVYMDVITLYWQDSIVGRVNRCKLLMGGLLGVRVLIKGKEMIRLVLKVHL